MRRFPLFIIIAICFLFYAFSSYAPWGDCVEEEGEIIRKELKIADFNQLQLNGSSTVYLKMGESQKIEIETTPNIIEILETDVKENKWSIKFEKCLKTKKGVKFYVTVPEIKSLAVAGSGDIIGKSKIQTDKLELKIKGSGDMSLSLVVDQLNASIHGSGDIKLSGSTKDQMVSINGSGDYTAFELSAENSEVKVNGSGDVKISTNKSINAKVNGSGDISYKGNPAKVSSTANGSGDITAY